jgi:hypothetical protein
MENMENMENLEHKPKYLGDVGSVYVTQRAVQEYADHRGLPLEDARRELTELLVDAYQPLAAQTEGGGYHYWRRRSRAARVDISARVSYEGRLAVVVAVTARHYNPPKKRRIAQ